MQHYFITGTDTDVGKTVTSAWAMLHLNAAYWKPVQTGSDKDIDTIKTLTGLGNDHFYNSAYELTEPLSPHEAAKRDSVEIDMEALTVPETDKPLIVEGAGGLMVPLNKDKLIIDLMVRLGFPAILVCRSALGTINHTLLSLEAMRARGLTIKGLILSGEKSPHNREALEEYGGAPIIAELDYMDPLNKESILDVKPEISL